MTEGEDPLAKTGLLRRGNCGQSLRYIESQISWVSLLRGLRDRQICGDRVFLLNSQGTACTDVFRCLFCLCLCSGSTGLRWFLPVSESDVYSSVSSSFLSSFHCFVSDISLLDSCALHMTGVTFYFYTGGCAAAACRPKIKAHLNYQSSKKKCFYKMLVEGEVYHKQNGLSLIHI